VSELIKLTATLLDLSRLGDRLARRARRGALALAFAFAGTLLVAAAFGCAIAALWLFLQPLLGPVGASLAAAGALLLLALVALLVARRVSKRQPALLAHPIDPSSLAAEIGQLMKSDKSSLLIAAAVAGLLAGTARRGD
jgi:hypothetical protein